MSYDKDEEEFVVTITTKDAIDANTKYSITMSNKDGDLVAVTDPDAELSSACTAGETFTLSVPYEAVSGTGTYVVKVVIGDMVISGNRVVA